MALVGFLFVLGLSRLANDVQWRHVALHQVNFLQTGALAVLAAAELLPLLDIGAGDGADAMALGATAAIAAAVAVAVATPRRVAAAAGAATADRAVPQDAGARAGARGEGQLAQLLLDVRVAHADGLDGHAQPGHHRRPAGLPWYDDPVVMLERALGARERSKGSTLLTVLRFARAEIIESGVWVAVGNVAALVPQFAMYQLLTYLGDPGGARLHPGLWIFLLFAGPVARSVCWQQYIFVSTRIIVRVKSGFTQELYHRAMTSMELDDDILDGTAKDAGDKGQKATSAGRLANLMASDIDAICGAKDTIIVLAGTPVGMALSFLGLYKILGWPALVGVAIILVTTPPVPTWLAQLIGHVQRGLKLAQDSRISLVSEYLASIRAIKYFAWEAAMTRHISDARDREQQRIWRINVLWVFVQIFTGTMPILALLAMFSLYVGAMGQPLTAATAFTSLSLMATLRGSVNELGFLSKNTMSAWISIKRLDKYFDFTAPLTRPPSAPCACATPPSAAPARPTSACATSRSTSSRAASTPSSARAAAARPPCLLSLLGETVLEAGAVTCPDDVAFASQTAWLQSATIKENVLFHAQFEQARYDRVIEACCLPVDFAELPDGEATEVGENGTSLSGKEPPPPHLTLFLLLLPRPPFLLLTDPRRPEGARGSRPRAVLEGARAPARRHLLRPRLQDGRPRCGSCASAATCCRTGPWCSSPTSRGSPPRPTSPSRWKTAGSRAPSRTSASSARPSSSAPRARAPATTSSTTRSTATPPSQPPPSRCRRKTTSRTRWLRAAPVAE